MVGRTLLFRRRRAARRLAALLVAWLAPTAAAGATAGTLDVPSYTERWRWVQFTTESGLPANRIHLIEEPAGGPAWVASGDALAWFDGFFWRPAGAPPGGTGRIDALTAIGSRLVVVSERGVFVAADTRGPLRPVRSARPVAPPFVSAARLSAAAAVVVGADGSLWRLEAETLVPWQPTELAGAPVRAVFDTALGRAWLVSERGLYRWSGTQWERRWPATTGLMVSALCEDVEETGILAIADPVEDRGVWHWSAGGRPARVETLPRGLVTSVACAPGGEVLVAYDVGHVFARRDGRWTRLDDIVPPLANVVTLRTRSTGDLWVAADTALYVFRRSAHRWRVWRDADDPARSVVNEILRARDGTTWLATGRGIVRVSPAWVVEPPAAGDPLADHAVTALGEDARGRIWAGSGGSFTGVYRHDGHRWRRVATGTALDRRYVHKIRRDRRGRLWFLTLSAHPGYPNPPGEAPAVFVLDDDRIESWPDSQGLPGNRVYAFAEAQDGTRWFGTSGGLSRWKDGAWRHWTAARGFPATRGYTLALDAAGRVWVSDGASGLAYLEGDRVHRFTTRDGLASDAVWDLAASPDGTVWAATRGGLSWYRDGVWVSFGLESGLPSTRLWPVLPVASAVWVGSAAGLAVLDLSEQALPIPRVEAREVATAPQRAWIKWQVAAWWGELAPTAILTRVRLDDGAWWPWSTARERRFDDLSPGAHVAVIQAANLFGRHDAGTTVSFRVPPPLWRDGRIIAAVSVSVAIVLGLTGALVVKQRRHRALVRAHQARAAEIERLETVARLAGGVAHIFNNLLTVVMGHADLLAVQIDPGDPRRSSVGEIRAAADRAAHVVQQLLGFAQRQPMTPTVVDLNAVVVSTGELIRRVVEPPIEVRVDLAPAPAWVKADPAQIEHVLVQLAVNARDTMPAGGRLTIAVSHVDIEARSGAARSETERCILLRVSDTGAGIAPEVLPHIFEPFFTTKGPHLAAGLGLSSCYGIVRQHGGWIDVESRPGGGTTFRIYLPKAAPPSS